MVHDTFNENCTGIKRDVSALKMKLKNLKAHNKKMKLNVSGTKVEHFDDTQESDQDVVGEIVTDQSAVSSIFMLL